MLYHLLVSLIPQFSVFNVARYITFRTAAASMTALVDQPGDGPVADPPPARFPDRPGDPAGRAGVASRQGGYADDGRPLILAAALTPTLLWADLTNVFVWIAVITTAVFGGIGFLDDYLKITRRTSGGLAPRYKFGLQMLVGLGAGPRR